MSKKFLNGLVLTLATWGVFFTLLWPHLLYWKEGAVMAGNPNTWGDWAGHFSHASKFAYQPVSLWLTHHPLFIAKKEIYPFLADAISGLLIRGGIDPVAAFIFPSIITTLLFLALLYTLYFQNLKTSLKSFFATTIFLACGGLGFVYFFQDVKNLGLAKVLELPPQEYTHISKEHIELINVVVSQIIPQRGLLLGMVMALFALVLLTKITSAKKPLNNFLILISGLFTGFLVIAHVHSYLFLTICGFFFFVLSKGHRKQIALFFISSGIVSIPLYLNIYFGQIGSGFMKFYPGWMARSQNTNWLYFVAINWGLFLPLAIFGIIKYKFYKNAVVLGSLTAFILSNLMLFQPFDWDNTKVLIWAFMGLTIPVMATLGHLWQKNLLTKFITIVFFVILTFSGFIDLYRLTKTDKLELTLFSKDDIKIAREFRALSKPGEVVLTSDSHNHFVPTQTGAQMMMGFRGWLWTYGIDYGVVESHVRTMYQGGDMAKKLLKEDHVKYVVVDQSAIDNFMADESFFQKNYRLVLQSPTARIYKIN